LLFSTGSIVDTYWDIGSVHDAVWFVQQVGKEVRFIDYEEAEGATWAYWARKLRDKDYLYSRPFAPFDIVGKEKAGEQEAAKTRLDWARDLGIFFQITPFASFENGVDAIRGLLGLCSFDEEKTAVGRKHLEQWGRVWNRLEQRYTDFEARNPHTHAGAAARYAAINIRQSQGYDVTKTREELHFKQQYRRDSGGSAMSV